MNKCDIQNELLDLKSDDQTRDSRISSLEAKFCQAQNDLKKCNLQNNNNAKYSRKNTFRIFAVEQRAFKNENIYDIIHNRFTDQLKLQDIDVEVAHRVGPVKKLMEL